MLGVLTGVAAAVSLFETPLDSKLVTNNMILRAGEMNPCIEECYFVADRRWGRY
jgi:hypothetical protein